MSGRARSRYDAASRAHVRRNDGIAGGAAAGTPRSGVVDLTYALHGVEIAVHAPQQRDQGFALRLAQAGQQRRSRSSATAITWSCVAAPFVVSEIE